MIGLLTIAARFPLPMQLYELGASAGLNLLLDRFEYDLGGLRCGSLSGPLQLKPRWKGGSPPDTDVSIVGRRGVDRDTIGAI